MDDKDKLVTAKSDTPATSEEPGLNFQKLGEREPPPDAEPSATTETLEMALTETFGPSYGVETQASDSEVGVKKNLFGTLEIDGVGSYYVFVAQTTLRVTWILTERAPIQELRDQSHVEAVLRVFNTGRMEGLGKTYLLSRLLEGLNAMVGLASQSGSTTAGHFKMKGEYHSEHGEDMIIYEASPGGRTYNMIAMVYEGFRLNVSRYNQTVPAVLSRNLLPVQDNKNKAAMVAGLGVRTFALLARQRGESLDWYKKKRYKLIQSNEEFQYMMLDYLRTVQIAHDSNAAILTALDTETTGLNMLKLDPENPLRDYIVAIPFGWRDDEAYVICTEMYYFNNVDANEVYPIFDQLFHRNSDYSYQDIVIDYCGEHFEFSRRNIMLVGANVGFDERAFMSHDCDVFFDEDIQIMHYNLATDWVQGRNGLKWMEHHYLGVETLELEDLFGPRHQDKFRYLSDPDLALVYGGADADFPRILWRKFRRILPDNLYKLYKKYDITTLYRTARATWLGMPIDERKVKEQGEAVLRDLETLKDFIYRYAYAANRSNLEDKSSKLCQLLGIDSVQELTTVGEQDGMYRYPFTPANHKNLMFNILGYPVIKMSEKTQEPALDKFVLKKLAEMTLDTPSEALAVDIMSESDPGTPLISKDKFNKLRYPLASVFQTYATLNKEYTAYYKPIITNDLEGRMFYNFSMQRAATRRILSPGQTMKGSLKKLVIAPRGKLFMCFDASQIEYRHMASMAYKQTKVILQEEHPDDWEQRLRDSGIARIHRMMQQPESDYHIETASMMTGKPQYKVLPAERKMYKSIGFGIPYGLGDRSMCESLYGKITKENMEKTKEVLDDYKARQFEIIRLLETVRDSAFIPAQIPDEFRQMLDIGDTHVGIVRNFVGFYRLFILEKLTRARTGRIRRQAGNCVIQGGAAELFRRMLYNFHQGCVAEGINEKIEWLMLVHDEVDTIIDDDMDVCKLIRTLHNSCTLRYEDHIPYYIGIGFGHDWKEAKGDSSELPVIMVERLIEAYNAGHFSIPCDGNQPENLLKLKRHYECDRVGEELQNIVGRIGENHVWSDRMVEAISEGFTNYTVRAYLNSFLSKEEAAQYGKDVPMKVMLDAWLRARKEYGFDVDFLDERFEDGRQRLKTLDLSFDGPDAMEFDMSEGDEFSFTFGDDRRSEDQEELLQIQAEEEWFSEDSLFDPNSDTSDVMFDADTGYRYLRTEKEEEDDNFVVNSNATNAFDVFVSTQYVRKCIFQSGENTYTVMLKGTPYANKVVELGRAIKQEYGVGSGTLLLMGNDIRRATNIALTPENLDSLDKLLTGGDK